MDGLEQWEQLQIDGCDLLTALAAPSSAPPPPLPPPPPILPSKRRQSCPSMEGILNRFKKQNVTQTLAHPILSFPPPNPNTRVCRNDENFSPQNPNTRVCRPNDENLEGEERIKRVSIAGPAGAVQRALHKKEEEGCRGFGDDRTRGMASSCSSRNEDDDVDFKEPAWLSAIDYLQRERRGCSEAKFSVKPTISFIKKRGNIDRIPQVLGIIKTCTPNKLGSVLVTLKDPTGTIGGSIEHRVMTDSEFGINISVGAVLLLRQVVVFSPTPWAHYLNITITNVEKVFKKGSCLPERQDGASTSKNRSSLPPDMFKEGGSVRLSADRASQQDGIFCSKKHEATNHILHSRLIDENAISTQNAGFQQHNQFTIDNNLEGRKAPPQEDNSQQILTHENITATTIPYNKNNVLKVVSSEQDPHTGTNCALENVKVCCNRKESIPVTIDWNDEVELLMADPFDLFD